MTFLFALAATLCAVAAAGLFITSWREGDVLVTVVLAVALFAVLVVTIVAWRAILGGVE